MRALKVVWVAGLVACSGGGPSGVDGGSAGGIGASGGGLATGGGTTTAGGAAGGGAAAGGSAAGGSTGGGSTAGGSAGGGSVGGGSAGGGSAGGGSVGGGSAGGGSAGGGSVGGGSVGGGSVGGGSVGGGSTGSGIFTIDAIDFDEPRVVVDSAGVTHIAFTAFLYSTAPQSQQFYGRCASNCTSGASWSFVTIGSYGDFGGSTQLVVGPNDSLHMLFTREQAGSGSHIIYARCTQANCAMTGAWSTVEIPLAGGYLMPRDSKLLGVDSNGVPAFVYSSNSSSNIYYVRCSMPDCLQPGSWLEANIQNGGDRFDLQFQGTTAYLGYLDYGSGTGGYATCASNCFNGPSWSRVEPFYAGRGSGHDSVAMGLGAGGAVHLVFNQGTTGPAVPQAHKQFDNQLRYWSCSSNCLTATNWSGLAFNSDQGSHGVDLALLPGGGVAFATSNINTSQTWQCGASCQAPGTVWNTQVVDSLTALQAFRPAMQSTPCGSSPATASWYPSRGLKLGATSNRLKVLSGTKIIYQCSFGGQYASFGGVGRYAEVPY